MVPASHLPVPQLVVQVLVDVEHRLGHRHVDPLPATRLLALVQRGEHGRRHLQRGVHVGVARRVVGVHGATGVALRLGQPALGADDGRVRPAVRPRPGGAVPGDRRVDESRVLGQQRVRPESHPLHHAGAVVLDEHVAVPGEVGGELRAARGRQVDADVALAGVLLHEVRRLPVDARRGEAGQVARRWLDLDDVGAEVGEHPRAVRPGQHAREVEDTNVKGQPWHRRYVSR